MSECLDISIDIASALVEAHDRKIVHRDLKPGNVMLTARGAKILDFGLAHIAADDHEQITREGEITGTVPYMAPEQIRGEVSGSAVEHFQFRDSALWWR